MRPMYESAEDRAAEDEVAEQVAALRGLRNARFPTGATVDRVLLDEHGQIRALLEIKTRRTPVGAYPTYCVSEERMNVYRLIAARLNVPALLAVRWSDALGLIDVRNTSFQHLATGGRTDRGDARDVEPMVHFPVERFRMIACADLPPPQPEEGAA